MRSGEPFDTVPLRALVDRSRGITYGIVQPGPHVEGGVPIIRVGDMRGGAIATEAPLRVGPAVEAAHARTRLRGGEVLLSVVGTVGEVAIVPSALEGWNVARAVCVIPTSNPDDGYWISFALRATEARQCMREWANDTVQATLNLRDVAELPVPMPSLGDRIPIESLLGALDDKIALNARMNATLEAMARAVFEDWFVHFGPVRAKAEGRAPPGLAPDLAALFPDRLTETPEGEVPEGWAFGPLGDICTLQRGFDLPKAHREDGDVPIISSSGITGFHSRAVCLPPGIVTGRYGTIGQVFMLDRPYWPLNTSLFVADFKGHPPHFVFHTLVGLPFDQFSDKAAVPGINRNHLHQARVVLPPQRLMAAFDETVGPMQQRCFAAASESQTLTTLRDLLLPRLISGKLRLRDAERAVEAVL